MKEGFQFVLCDVLSVSASNEVRIVKFRIGPAGKPLELRISSQAGYQYERWKELRTDDRFLLPIKDQGGTNDSQLYLPGIEQYRPPKEENGESSRPRAA